MPSFFRFLIVGGLLLPSFLSAQGPSPTATQNYILSRTARVEAATAAVFDVLNLSTESQVGIQYIDGLGRPIQQIGLKAAPDQSDVVVAMEYDEFGRQEKQYLPYNVNTYSGQFQAAAFGDQLDFYEIDLVDPNNLDLTNDPWAETVFEASPLNRVLEQGAPGTPWQPGTGHTQRSDYRSNTASEVYRFPVDATVGQTYSNKYAAGELMVQEVMDENDHYTLIFTDKLGRVILQQQELGGPDVRTYTLYDAFGRVKYILQPEGVAAFESSGYGGTKKLSQSLLDDYAFQYEYDARGRVIRKRVPGADWVSLIYDPLDRVIMTQDAVQETNDEWSFTKYDVLGRPIQTGLCEDTRSYATLQSNLNSHWDNQVYQLFEKRSTNTDGYTENQAFPLHTQSDFTLHSVTYYDNYDFNRDGDESDANEVYEAETLYADGAGNIGNDIFTRNRGQVTAVRIWILNPDGDMPASLFTRTYYDKYGREIQTLADNHLGGYEQVSYDYNFAGELLHQVHRHSPDGTAETAIQQWYSYDHRSRLLKQEQQTGSGLRVILTENAYNELGQVKEENLHSQNQGADYQQSIDYAYNERGWLTDINTVDPTCSAPASEDFATQIEVQAIVFQVMDVGVSQSYDFRLKTGDYKDVTFFSPSQGASYTQSGDLVSDIYVNIPGTVRSSDLPSSMTVSFSPDELVLDGQYGAVFTAISNQINTDFPRLSASQRSAMLLDIQTALATEYDNIFQGDDYLDLFRMKLLYNEGFTDMDLNAQPQFNGNISGVQWQTPLDCAVRGYGFGYDELNRLEIAEYGEQTSSSSSNWTQNANAFNSLYQYDLNGNFTNLSRNKPNGSGGSEFMDVLTYSHYDGNRLLRVSDGASFPETPGVAQFLDLNTTGFDDYEYDAMGNLSQDRHKGVSMTYNHFNKPTEVQGSGEKIVYIYSADGTKLRQKVIDTENPALLKVTDYAGMYQYEDPDGAGTEPKALSFIMHPKGRILDDGSGYTYQYFLKDHLGNTRVMFGDLDGDGKINPDPAIAQDVDQVVDYYPFGLAMSASQAPVGTPAQNYTYNGKELQDELGLGWLDYGARMYDPSIARWNGVDAHAEFYSNQSPFSYVFNNPMRFVDPNGMDPSDSTKKKMQPAPEGGGAVDAGTTNEVVIVDKVDNSRKGRRARRKARKKIAQMGIPATGTQSNQSRSYEEKYKLDLPSFSPASPEEEGVTFRDNRPGGAGQSSFAGNALEALIDQTGKQFQIVQEGIRNNVQYYGSVDEPISEGVYATKHLTGKQSIRVMSALDKAQKVLTPTVGKALGVVGVAMTLADAGVNGIENHHYADVVLGLAFTFIPGTQLIGLAYYATDALIRYSTGKSITQHVFD